MRDLWLDLRFGIRSLLRTPAFTAAALATLALGIGASLAIFGVVDGVLIRRLPYGRPDELVRVWPAGPFSGELFDQLRERARTVEGLSAVERTLVAFLEGGEPEELTANRVTPGTFATLRSSPSWDAFAAEEGRPG
ncbi:MAG: hypothetical protein R2991_14240 [Thermoanaerobaculia bacterium]